MLLITSPRHGAILNRHDGAETDGALTIEVSGDAPPQKAVTVNGMPTTRHANRFRALVTLRDRVNDLTVRCENAESTTTVLYDRGSFRRYRFSLDDNIRFLRDIARQQPRSIFDNPYMALWKRIHDTYGTKINCNIYFQCDGFDLTMMPERYKAEWQDHANWFRMTFHALQDDPKQPYIQAGYEQLAHDIDLVNEQIRRFAGEHCLNQFTTIHWGEATREGCRAVRDRGIRGLCGYFKLDAGGNPTVAYYADRELTRYMATRDYWKDLDENLIFIRHDMVVNGVALNNIRPQLDAVAANPQQRDVMELMIHEQYFYPDYGAFLPDYAQRCETAVRWMADHGYEPVFYSDGFLGVPS